MKQLYGFMYFILFANIAVAQIESGKQVFKSPTLTDLVMKSKTVAILPFNVSISYKKMPKGVSLENVKDNEKQESILAII